MPEFYRVREAFAFTGKNGVPRVLTPGELLTSDDPDLKGREQFCEPVGEYVSRTQGTVSETASAAPGERRVRSQSPKSFGAKPGADVKSTSSKEETGS